MKAIKKFIASEIVEYRKSNSTKQVSFDTLEEAINHVKKERELHPRSKKFDPIIIEHGTGKRINALTYL